MSLESGLGRFTAAQPREHAKIKSARKADIIRVGIVAEAASHGMGLSWRWAFKAVLSQDYT
ncbi:MAG: hypothetical protein QNL91_13715 [Candidatus Krumholzibacteria bacterium]|nr:hypothetical protein [Candidatus Krumholzibacteria bacterium]